ncbi:hypothetical protein [Natrinema sp. 1APR25-10V2]|uniref:hypothetical protein n=1 Tax=Natrinema sp. 1APR25-10V2 TaxID=2951081 RepID=UPI002876E290|nr:hypothetical protein [Natrinema sp. 1APR25-10V2]MDS0477102.1 hypothetical protein [Natrinema sp. 1APR25-10V2]
MTNDRLRDDLLIAVALAEFSYRHEIMDPQLAKWSWQLAVNRLDKYDIDPSESIDALRALDDLSSQDVIDAISIENVDR